MRYHLRNFTRSRTTRSLNSRPIGGAVGIEMPYPQMTQIDDGFHLRSIGLICGSVLGAHVQTHRAATLRPRCTLVDES
jgi:hypothetical protein